MKNLHEVMFDLHQIENEGDSFESGLAKGMLHVAKRVVSIISDKTLAETSKMGRLETARIIAKACDEVGKEINLVCDGIEAEQ